MVPLKFFLLQWVEYQTYLYSDHGESEYWEKKIQATISLSSLEIFASDGNKYQRRQWVHFFRERNIFSKNLFRARSSGPGTATEISAHRDYASLWDHGVVRTMTDNQLQRSFQSKYFRRFSRKEIKRIYWSFKNECPSGLVNQETFHAIYSKFFPAGGRIWHQFLINFLKRTKLYWTACLLLLEFSCFSKL